MVLEVPRRRFSFAEYHLMAERGILSEDDRVEFIGGEIVEMTPIGRAHAACVDRIAERFAELFRRDAQVRVQSPVQLGDHSEVQPDVTLLCRRSDFYASGHPTPADVLLLVEMADSSLDYEREIKLPLYARYGIAEVWLVNLIAGTITGFREPTISGYQSVRPYRRGEWLSPGAFPGREMGVSGILG